MWTSREIENETFLYRLTLNKETVNYFLCDLKQMWKEECTVDEILTRAQKMNRLIECDRKFVFDCIQRTPENIKFNNDFETPTKDGRNIQLTYHLESTPFYFKWDVQLCSKDEFLHFVTNPLLLSLSCMAKQNEELKEIIRRKDVEIDQYKHEGAVLKRSAVATYPFHLKQFNAKYPKLDSVDFTRFARESFENLKTACSEFISYDEVDIIEEPVSKPFNNNKLIKTPKRSRNSKYHKYKSMANRKRLLVCNANMNYDDSDSCTPPLADEDDITTIKKQLENLKKKQNDDSEKISGVSTPKKAQRRLNL